MRRVSHGWVAILAIVIPAMFLYLMAVNPQLIAPVTSTALGQYVLLPVAVLLEVAGIPTTPAAMTPSATPHTGSAKPETLFD